MTISYILRDDPSAFRLGDATPLYGHLEIWEARENAQRVFILSFGKRKLWIIGIQQHVILSIDRWRPSDEDVVAAMEKALQTG
jgi:hypothetical protein